MRRNPLVSVVMSVFNGEDCVSVAIESILGQDFVDFEFIIVNDGSLDNTKAIIESYSDKRILLINQLNNGLTKSLNVAIEHSSGKYIARQDADDVSYPSRLRKQIELMERSNDVVLVGSRAIINNNGLVSTSPYLGESIVRHKLKRFKVFVHSSVMFRKKTFYKIGLYNERFITSQDYDAWIRLLKFGRLLIINDALLERNLSKESISTKRHTLQCINGYKIRKNIIPIYLNFYYTLLHYFSAKVPLSVVRLIRVLKKG